MRADLYLAEHGAPIIGYHYGANNREELRNVFQKSMRLMTILGVGMTLIAVAFASPLARIFTGTDKELWALTTRGLRLYALCFLLSGVNIFTSSFFTALSNGVLSLTVSLFRTLVCQILAILLLPLVWEADGIWVSTACAEFVALFLGIALLKWKRKYYGY